MFPRSCLPPPSGPHQTRVPAESRHSPHLQAGHPALLSPGRDTDSTGAPATGPAKPVCATPSRHGCREGRGGLRDLRSSRTSQEQPSAPRPDLRAERLTPLRAGEGGQGQGHGLSLSHRPSPGEGEGPLEFRGCRRVIGAPSRPSCSGIRESLAWEPEVSWGAWGRGAPARGGDDTPGPEVRKLQETRDTPLCGGGRDLVDLLHSLAKTLKFLQNAHVQALPRPGRGGGPGVLPAQRLWQHRAGPGREPGPPCPQPGRRPGRRAGRGAGGTRLSPRTRPRTGS